MPHIADVIVVGGGVIGLTLAWELARQDVGVTVLEKNDELGKEASWAGAGMLPPGNPETATTLPEHLRGWSHRLWPTLSGELLEETGIDNGFRVNGSIRVSETGAELPDEIAVWSAERVPVEPLDAAELIKREPSLNPELAGGYRLPTAAQVRNPRHTRTLVAACERRGVRFRVGVEVMSVREHRGEVKLSTTGETIDAGAVCLTAGAWMGRLLKDSDRRRQIFPVRGQIVQLFTNPPILSNLIEDGSRYIVSRDDGFVLIGSTEEDVGFEKANTADGVSGLLGFARRLVPALRNAKFCRAWSGLRPATATGVPLLGRVPGCDSLYAAGGHFRSGLQMSPASGRVMRQLLLDHPLDFPLPPL